MQNGLVTASIASEKAELLNQLFHSVFNTSLDNCPQYFSSLPTSSLSSIDISYEDTFMALTSLDSSKAMGGDGIPPHILKHSATVVLYPIHHLFMLCLAQSYLALEWQTHYITPIPMSRDLSSVSNYQTISLLYCWPKLLEKLVFDKVSEFWCPPIYHFSSLGLSELFYFAATNSVQWVLHLRSYWSLSSRLSLSRYTQGFRYRFTWQAPIHVLKWWYYW